MTPFEKFENRLAWQVGLTFFGGMVVIAIAYQSLGPSLVLVAVIGLWLLASLATASRLRGRHETVAAYKARVGYKNPD